MFALLARLMIIRIVQKLWIYMIVYIFLNISF